MRFVHPVDILVITINLYQYRFCVQFHSSLKISILSLTANVFALFVEVHIFWFQDNIQISLPLLGSFSNIGGLFLVRLV